MRIENILYCSSLARAASLQGFILPNINEDSYGGFVMCVPRFI